MIPSRILKEIIQTYHLFSFNTFLTRSLLTPESLRPLPVGGNGAGAPPRGTQQTAGALGKGTVVAAAVTSSFGFLVYALVSILLL